MHQFSEILKSLLISEISYVIFGANWLVADPLVACLVYPTKYNG